MTLDVKLLRRRCVNPKFGPCPASNLWYNMSILHNQFEKGPYLWKLIYFQLYIWRIIHMCNGIVPMVKMVLMIYELGGVSNGYWMVALQKIIHYCSYPWIHTIMIIWDKTCKWTKKYCKDRWHISFWKKHLNNVHFFPGMFNIPNIFIET